MGGDQANREEQLGLATFRSMLSADHWYLSVAATSPVHPSPYHGSGFNALSQQQQQHHLKDIGFSTAEITMLLQQQHWSHPVESSSSYCCSPSSSFVVFNLYHPSQPPPPPSFFPTHWKRATRLSSLLNVVYYSNNNNNNSFDVVAAFDDLVSEFPHMSTSSTLPMVNKGESGGNGGVGALLVDFTDPAARSWSGFQPKRSLGVILFTSEEPTRLGISCLGSQLLPGSEALAETLKETVDGQNMSFFDAARSAGYANGQEDLSSVFLKKGHYSGFLELHIEQGPILEEEGTSIGIVTAIAAPASIFFQNFCHAGAVLMPARIGSC